MPAAARSRPDRYWRTRGCRAWRFIANSRSRIEAGGGLQVSAPIDAGTGNVALTGSSIFMGGTTVTGGSIAATAVGVIGVDTSVLTAGDGGISLSSTGVVTNINVDHLEAEFDRRSDHGAGLHGRRFSCRLGDFRHHDFCIGSEQHRCIGLGHAFFGNACRAGSPAAQCHRCQRVHLSRRSIHFISARQRRGQRTFGQRRAFCRCFSHHGCRIHSSRRRRHGIVLNRPRGTASPPGSSSTLQPCHRAPETLTCRRMPGWLRLAALH